MSDSARLHPKAPHNQGFQLTGNQVKHGKKKNKQPHNMAKTRSNRVK